MEDILVDSSASGVLTIMLNRPEQKNAFTMSTVDAVSHILRQAADDPHLRAVVVAAAGDTFSAGGDLSWMQAVLDDPEGPGRRDVSRLGRLLETIASFPVPVIARVNGAAYGGGFGLVCASDIAIAGSNALFGLTEVRLGSYRARSLRTSCGASAPRRCAQPPRQGASSTARRRSAFASCSRSSRLSCWTPPSMRRSRTSCGSRRRCAPPAADSQALRLRRKRVDQNRHRCHRRGLADKRCERGRRRIPGKALPALGLSSVRRRGAPGVRPRPSALTMRRGVEAGPLFIKPNRDEIEALTGR